MSVLPVSNIINVTITNTPLGLSEKNVNTLAIFTNEATNSLAAFEEHVGAQTVGQDYGTDSLTYQMAAAIFSQSPNIRTGNGRLVVIPMVATGATSGEFATANITANLTALQAVSSGDIRVTVDGVTYDLTGMNFTKAASWADVAAILQARLVAGTVTAIATGFRITSKKVGTGSTVALAAVPAGTGTALNGSGFFNAAGGTSATGANSSGETILSAIARTTGAVGCVGVLTTLSLEDTALLAAAAGVQSMDKMLHYAGASVGDFAGVGTSIKNGGFDKTRFKVFTKGVVQAKLMNAAYAGRGHSVDVSGSNTSQTMNLKQLATIEPDTGITQTMYQQAEVAGVDIYVSFDGVSSVVSNGANDYFDNVYSDLALKFALETAGFNFLRQTNTKVPQTEDGMNGLKGAYAIVMDRFVRNGSLAPGEWSSSETFGDPVIFRTNISTRGYYGYSTPIAQQSPSERQARKAPLVQLAAKRAGAIHKGDVIVVVND